MKKKELLQLAEYLETSPVVQKEWNFSFWGYRVNDCHTTSCALGHACSLFPDNLQLVWENSQLSWRRDTASVYDNTQTHSNGIAAANFFEITCHEAEEIFYSNGYPGFCMVDISPQMVAAKIREIVSKG
jgi:hypothetical protein